jgi:hypothetical protein
MAAFWETIGLRLKSVEQKFLNSVNIFVDKLPNWLIFLCVRPSAMSSSKLTANLAHSKNVLESNLIMGHVLTILVPL